eukprot:m.17734 g.17734  ORF g.17734 m.17734 type:complete len:73 (+) comp4828_c0_seq1:886-1104(+)
MIITESFFFFFLVVDWKRNRNKKMNVLPPSYYTYIHSHNQISAQKLPRWQMLDDCNTSKSSTRKKKKLPQIE